MYRFLRIVDNKLSAFLEGGGRLSSSFISLTGESFMQIIVESRDADATPMRELSIARVRFALRRLKALVPRAKVQFSDVNGPAAASTSAARSSSRPTVLAPS
jgi:hypothetical protein